MMLFFLKPVWVLKERLYATINHGVKIKPFFFTLDIPGQALAIFTRHLPLMTPLLKPHKVNYLSQESSMRQPKVLIKFL